jgi:hypothetical protein
MTFQQIIWAINDAAELAAESAFDAFGADPNAEFPPAAVAWDFINTLYDDGEIPRPPALPTLLLRQFKHDYARHIRVLRARRAAPAS